MGLHRGRRSPDHVPRVDRPRSAHGAQPGRCGHQLHGAFAGTDDGAARQHLRVGRRRAASRAALRLDRSRHRLGGVGARSDGRGLPQAPHVGAAEVAAAARATTSVARASPASRRTGPASTWPVATTWSTTSCGPTTSHTTRARGRTRRRRSSAPWAISTTANAPRSSGSTAPASSSSRSPIATTATRRRRRRRGVAGRDAVVSERTLRGSAAVVGVGETEYYKWGGRPTPSSSWPSRPC